MNFLSTIFAKSFLYPFGLTKNPLESLYLEHKEKSDIDQLAKDWEKVGKDIKKAYEQYEQEISKCQATT
jgi:hypothetical protein